MANLLSDDERAALQKILAEAHTKAGSADYPAAQALVEQAREKDPANIYVLAFEKQVEQLVSLSSTNSLTEESRTDILDSLGGIIDRAIAVDSQTGPTETSATSEERTPVTREDQAAAMEWLKSQYFQQAHHYVRKAEYDHALAEIRRVFIIEPNNVTARQFETHILELRDLRRVVPEEAATPAAHGPVSEPKTSAATPASDAKQQSKRGPLQPARRRSMNVVLGIIAVAVAFIGFALIYNWVRTPEVAEGVPPVVVPQPEEYFVDPSTVPDTTRRAVSPEQGGAPSSPDHSADTTSPTRTVEREKPGNGTVPQQR